MYNHFLPETFSLTNIKGHDNDVANPKSKLMCLVLRNSVSIYFIDLQKTIQLKSA
jgi:hypothetical protein